MVCGWFLVGFLMFIYIFFCFFFFGFGWFFGSMVGFIVALVFFCHKLQLFGGFYLDYILGRKQFFEGFVGV